MAHKIAGKIGSTFSQRDSLGIIDRVTVLHSLLILLSQTVLLSKSVMISQEKPFQIKASLKRKLKEEFIKVSIKNLFTI